MDAQARVRLRIVPAAQVRPHEIADPARESRIEERLREDGILRDPLMVGAIPEVEGYVLLDGTNRRRALATLKLPLVLAQVLDYGNEYDVQLRTWCHSTDVPLEDVIEPAREIPGIVVKPLEPLSVHDVLRDPTTLAIVAARHEQYALRRTAEPSHPRAKQLRLLVDIYEARMARVDCAPEDVEERAQTLDGARERCLIAFPSFSRSQVVTMAMRGTLIPAGITRHVIMCGRALRVNIPLQLLENMQDPESANLALREHLAHLQPRFYREPTLLYDS
jgi:hypothetical protein